uniref:Major facilitator superfamily (MFS) profile domain-containing protein n=1 Tax=Ciona savignyi TaxID=51511 RepID=H2Z721_CIOSA
MNHSDLLNFATGFGRFQKRLVFLLVLSAFSHGFHLLITVFITYTPRHRCFIPEVDGVNATLFNGNSSNITFLPEQWKDSFIRLHIPWDDNTDWWNQCFRYSNITTNDAINTSEESTRFATIPCDKGWVYDVETGVTSATTEYNWVCDRSWYKTLATTIQMAGMMVGSLVGSLLSDRYGRRVAFLSNYIVGVLSVFLLAFNPFMLGVYVLLFFDGWAVIVRGFAVIVLISEMLPRKWRDTAAVLHNMVHSLGYAGLPLIAFLCKDWRWTVGVCGGIGILLLPPTVLVPESLRWLLENNRKNQADALVRRIAAINSIPLEATEKLLKELNHTKKGSEEKQLQVVQIKQKNETCNTQLLETQAMNSESQPRRYSYIHLARYSFLRYRILILCICWSSVNFCYFGVSLSTNELGGNRYLNCFLAALVELPGSFICYFLIRKFGSRIAFAIPLSTTGLLLIGTPLLRHVSETASITFAVLGKLFIMSGYTLLYTCTGDLFPTLLRNQAYGASSFVSRVVTLIVPYILYLGEAYDQSIPFILMAASAVLASGVKMLLPETKGRLLPSSMEESKEFKSNIQCYKQKEAQTANNNNNIYM